MRFNSEKLARRNYMHMIAERVSLVYKRAVGQYAQKGIQVHLIKEFMSAQKFFVQPVY